MTNEELLAENAQLKKDLEDFEDLLTSRTKERDALQKAVEKIEAMAFDAKNA